MSSKSASASGPDEIDPAEVSKDATSKQTKPIEESEDDMNGVVTCLQEGDMPALREAMNAPPVQISRAALAPLPSHLEQFATLLPLTTTQAHVFEIFPVISTTSPDYFVPSFGSPLKLAEKLSSIERLTIGERWLLGNAPVNLRDPIVLNAFVTFVEHFSIDESLKITQWLNAQGISGTLQAYRDAQDAYQQAQEDQSKEGQPQQDSRSVSAKGERKSGASQELTRLPIEVINFASSSNLLELESLHRCLGLYLWLGNRFTLRFPQSAEARLFKEEVQAAIDFILQFMSPAAKEAAEQAKKKTVTNPKFRRR
jgi:ATP-dependent RNA helicase SUPV3L1/SUV3